MSMMRKYQKLLAMAIITTATAAITTATFAAIDDSDISHLPTQDSFDENGVVSVEEFQSLYALDEELMRSLRYLQVNHSEVGGIEFNGSNVAIGSAPAGRPNQKYIDATPDSAYKKLEGTVQSLFGGAEMSRASSINPDVLTDISATVARLKTANDTFLAEAEFEMGTGHTYKVAAEDLIRKVTEISKHMENVKEKNSGAEEEAEASAIIEMKNTLDDAEELIESINPVALEATNILANTRSVDKNGKVGDVCLNRAAQPYQISENKVYAKEEDFVEGLKTLNVAYEKFIDGLDSAYTKFKKDVDELKYNSVVGLNAAGENVAGENVADKTVVSYKPVAVELSENGILDRNGKPLGGGIHQYVSYAAFAELQEALVEVDRFMANNTVPEHLAANEMVPGYFDNASKRLKTAVAEFNATASNAADVLRMAYDQEIRSLAVKVSGIVALPEATEVVAGVEDYEGLNFAVNVETVEDEKKYTLENLEVADGYFVSADGTGLDTEGEEGDQWVSEAKLSALETALQKSLHILNETANIKNVNDIEIKYPLKYVEKYGNGYFETATGLIKIADKFGFETIANVDEIADAKIQEAKSLITEARKSDVVDGLDLLTFEMLNTIVDSTAIPEANGVFTEKPADVLINQEKITRYLNRELMDDIIYATTNEITNTEKAITELEQDKNKENLHDLVKAIEAQQNKKVDISLDNAKVKLYNSYIEANRALWDENDARIQVSDMDGENIAEYNFYVSKAVMDKLTAAIASSYVNLTESVEKTAIVAQIATNEAAMKFEPKIGKATVQEISALAMAKGKLGTQLEKTEADLNTTISDLYGADVEAANKWTTAAAKAEYTNAYTQAKAEFESGYATEAKMKAALTALNSAATTFEATLQDGTKEAYQDVVAQMQIYIDNSKYGNNRNDGSTEGHNAEYREPVVAYENIQISNDGGMDLALTELWAAAADFNKIETAVLTAEKILENSVNLNIYLVKMPINDLEIERDKLKSAYETFYAVDINDHTIVDMASKIHYGQSGIADVQIKNTIAKAVEAVNDLVYMPGTNPLETTYTAYNGTAGQAYTHEKVEVEIVDAKIVEVDGDASRVRVTAKENGMDVIVGNKWIYAGAVEDYVDAISQAQRVVNSSKNITKAALDEALDTLNAAAETFEAAVDEKTMFDAASIAYEDLYIAVSEAFSLIGKDENGIFDYADFSDDGFAKLENTNGITEIRRSLTNTGIEVSETMNFVPTLVYKTYNEAIWKAKNALTTATTARSLETAMTTLQNVTDVIVKSATKSGKGSNEAFEIKRVELQNLAAEAEEIEYIVSTNGMDVAPEEQWITTNMKRKLDSAINTAKMTVSNAYGSFKEGEYDQEGFKVLMGTGRVLPALLDSKADELMKVIEEIEAEAKNGNADDMTVAKTALEAALNEAYQLKNIAQSSLSGTDVAGAIRWVTVEEIRIDNEEITPIAYISEAYDEAREVYMSNKKEDYSEAAATLEKQIAKFIQIIEDGVDGGYGKKDEVTEAKIVINTRIAEIRKTIAATIALKNADNSKVPFGRYYALSSDIELMNWVILEAASKMNKPGITATELTAGSTNGETNITNGIDNTSVLATLNNAYATFAGGVTTENGIVEEVKNTKRKLKTAPTGEINKESAESPLERVEQIIKEAFGNEELQVPSTVAKAGNDKDAEQNLIEYVTGLIEGYIEADEIEITKESYEAAEDQDYKGNSKEGKFTFVAKINGAEISELSVIIEPATWDSNARVAVEAAVERFEHKQDELELILEAEDAGVNDVSEILVAQIKSLISDIIADEDGDVVVENLNYTEPNIADDGSINYNLTISKQVEKETSRPSMQRSVTIADEADRYAITINDITTIVKRASIAPIAEIEEFDEIMEIGGFAEIEGI
ncbi:hypothetical protein [Candidatus Epulonipiscium viviparus]|uniref:hypothetical protein n=1 Tax=Candidatus Epulonipiscium viviparus TaxID=420336 RepID=UPI00273812AE|nr:hypothetical protein [Candidatus Epulopiscium viviparus]